MSEEPARGVVLQTFRHALDRRPTRSALTQHSARGSQYSGFSTATSVSAAGQPDGSEEPAEVLPVIRRTQTKHEKSRTKPIGPWIALLSGIMAIRVAVGMKALAGSIWRANSTSSDVVGRLEAAPAYVLRPTVWTSAG